MTEEYTLVHILRMSVCSVLSTKCLSWDSPVRTIVRLPPTHRTGGHIVFWRAHKLFEEEEQKKYNHRREPSLSLSFSTSLKSPLSICSWADIDTSSFEIQNHDWNKSAYSLNTWQVYAARLPIGACKHYNILSVFHGIFWNAHDVLCMIIANIELPLILSLLHNHMELL